MCFQSNSPQGDNRVSVNSEDRFWCRWLGRAIRILDHGYVVRVSSNAEIDHYWQRAESNWREIMYSGIASLGLVRGIWEGITRLQARRPVAPFTYQLMRRMTNAPQAFRKIDSASI
jgi:hypothetical protein